ncbi:hypothetical protein [Bradyrhizobium sp. AZCC 2289]|uniref:hypothetical protein n=1 Tax=Bradyrhizobium sp. AZCC 2289 TaxID=3117026 RepID=UPI002FF08226
MLDDSAKRAAMENELTWLALDGKADLASRYGELYVAVQSLPSKIDVNLDNILKEYLSRYIHEIQSLIVSKGVTTGSDANAHLTATHPGWDRLFMLQSLSVTSAYKFDGSIRVVQIAGERERVVDFSNTTNAGMREFAFRSSENAPV